MRKIIFKILGVISIASISFGLYVIGRGIYEIIWKTLPIIVFIAMSIGGITTILVYCYIGRICLDELKTTKR